jgi:hypothetical protein
VSYAAALVLDGSDSALGAPVDGSIGGGRGQDLHVALGVGLDRVLGRAQGVRGPLRGGHVGELVDAKAEAVRARIGLSVVLLDQRDGVGVDLLAGLALLVVVVPLEHAGPCLPRVQ